ncbi:MAG: hypothetical protein KDD25_03245 [Bdellovibrionales bacterium]|nr:hypothetical protein [Bdellovibrionales bacterium]
MTHLRKTATILSIVATGLLLNSCINQNNDELFEDASAELDRGKFENTIQEFNRLSEEYKSQREVKFATAKAHANKCGVNINEFVNELNTSSETFFSISTRLQVGADDSRKAHCDEAQRLLLEIGGAKGRSNEENRLMLFTSFAKIGAYINASSDKNGDGLPDRSWQPCDSSELSQKDATETTFSWGHALVSLQYLMLNGHDTGSARIEDLERLCTLLPIIDPSYDICFEYKNKELSRRQILAMRCLFDGPDLGFAVDLPDLLSCIDHAGGNAMCGN